jgi:hypothetical protein
MLISMPTGTSMIFGVFQAISALLVGRTNSVLPDKLVRNEKFASEIFSHSSRCFAALRRLHVVLRPEGQTKAGSTGSKSAVAIVMGSFAGQRNNRVKNVEEVQLLPVSPNHVDLDPCRGISSTHVSTMP